jgi:hypothetical protein
MNNTIKQLKNYKYNGKTYSTLIDMCKEILQGYDMTELETDSEIIDEAEGRCDDNITLRYGEDYDITESTIINPENHQMQVNRIIESEDVDYEDAKIELTLTTRYHNWHNTVADSLFETVKDKHQELNLELCDEIKFKELGITEEDIEEYNDLIVKINKYYDSSSLTLNSTITDIGVK